MKRIGIYSNKMEELGQVISKTIDRYLARDDIELYSPKERMQFLPHYVKPYEFDEQLDCILVFGGDGTILGAVEYSLRSSAPILGINMGRLGFLSDFSVKEFPKYINRLLDSEFFEKNKNLQTPINSKEISIVTRMLLENEVKHEGKSVYRGYALNDAVVYKGLVSRLIEIKFYCDKNFVVETRCDGIIAATPTGSTAYTLSAGGPILPPQMEALVVAALCPHVLSVRPMVFPASSELKFKMVKVYNETMLQLDGKNVHPLVDNDLVIVKAAKEKVGFITLTGKNFYQTLRKKLHMGKI